MLFFGLVASRVAENSDLLSDSFVHLPMSWACMLFFVLLFGGGPYFGAFSKLYASHAVSQSSDQFPESSKIIDKFKTTCKFEICMSNFARY